MSDNLSTLDSLPPEILTNVFLCLPIKSIVTYTAVCRTWKSLIENPTFISNHLHYSSNNNNKHPLLLFRLAKSRNTSTVGANENEQYVLHLDNQDFNEYTRFDDFPFQVGQIFHVVGTCNGLIFLADVSFGNHTNFFLWNPCVRKFVRLPKPNIGRTSQYNASVGFGFDSKTNDYKVVRFVYHRGKGQRGEAEVYSLSTGKWRMVTDEPPVGAARDSFLTVLNVFVNGALHWVALRKTENELLIYVMVFDLGGEKFREIALPKLSDQNGDGYWERRVSILAYGNSLALFQREDRCLSIWVMKHYADASSWNKIISLADAGAGFIERTPRSCCKPKCFRRSGEVILGADGGYLVSQDLEIQEIKDLRIRGYECTFVDSYVESLVLLDKHPTKEKTERKEEQQQDLLKSSFEFISNKL